MPDVAMVPLLAPIITDGKRISRSQLKPIVRTLSADGASCLSGAANLAGIRAKTLVRQQAFHEFQGFLGKLRYIVKQNIMATVRQSRRSHSKRLSSDIL